LKYSVEERSSDARITSAMGAISVSTLSESLLPPFGKLSAIKDS
jgi:hypothetical protein